MEGWKGCSCRKARQDKEAGKKGGVESRHRETPCSVCIFPPRVFRPVEFAARVSACVYICDG